MGFWIYYLLLINGLTFYLFWADKRRAERGLWRVPEKTLLLCSALGGATLGLVAMYRFHHKTRKPIFVWGMPLLVLLHILIFPHVFGANTL